MSEFIAEFEKVEKAANKAEAYQETFDANHDGKVTPEEIEAVITETDTDKLRQELEKVIKKHKLDSPRAARSEDILFVDDVLSPFYKDEVAKEAAATTLLDTNNNKKIEEKEVADFVAKTDTDNSGTISVAELEAAVAFIVNARLAGVNPKVFEEKFDKNNSNEWSLPNLSFREVLLFLFYAVPCIFGWKNMSEFSHKLAYRASGMKRHKLLSSIPITVIETPTMTPRAIMAEIFKLQCIFVDPTKVPLAAKDIATEIRESKSAGIGDGVNTFDVFLSYRVASDRDVAEKLYWMLKAKNIHAFFDKECLVFGEPWKTGFLTGLKNSKKFVAILSRKGLERVRDFNADHANDSVLLELETAIKIREDRAKKGEDKSYILPLLVGENLGDGLYQDFSNQMSPQLYPDTITP